MNSNRNQAILLWFKDKWTLTIFNLFLFCLFQNSAMRDTWANFQQIKGKTTETPWISLPALTAFSATRGQYFVQFRSFVLHLLDTEDFLVAFCVVFSSNVHSESDVDWSQQQNIMIKIYVMDSGIRLL